MQDHELNDKKHLLILICILLSSGLTTNKMWGHIYLSGEMIGIESSNASNGNLFPLFSCRSERSCGHSSAYAKNKTF
jgi:hypothetical protein